jgi:uncharacterized protein YbjT (DUF2867 family)
MDVKGEEAMPKTILITGATGSVSSAIFPILKTSGANLRALVHHRRKAISLVEQDVEVIEGDLGRPRTLGQAFDGADTVWILTAAGPRAPEHSSNALWAARKGGARHIVRMSAVGAAHDAPTINSRLHALSDAELVASGIPYTILKPHFFMQNLLMAAQSVATEGAIYVPMGEARLPMIDVRDISEAAARVLTTPGHEQKTYTLTGPRAVSIHDAATALSRALNKPVKYVPVPLEAADDALAKMGIDEWMRELLTDYFAAYSSNWGTAVTTDFEYIVRREPHSIEDFARDFAGAFGNPQSNASGA